MRTIVDIPNAQIQVLDKLSKKKNVSRAEIIRQALAKYIESAIKAKKNYKSVFGIWKKKDIDALSYQNKLRDEWNG